MPRQSGATTGYWIGENAGSDITASDTTLEQVNLYPHTLAARTVFSNMFMEMSQPAAETFLREDFSQQFGLGLDAGILTGSGASGQPLGITNQSGIGTSALTAAPTYNELLDIVAVVRNANALRGSLGWAMSPQQFTAIEKILDATNQPLNRRVVADGPITTLLGYPFATTTQLETTAGDANALIFGDWSQVKVGRWAGLRIAASDSNVFERDQTQIRGTMRCDVLVRHPEAFCANT